MIKPLNNRILATLVETEETDIKELEGQKPVDKYAKVKVVRSSVDTFKRSDILVVPAYVDTILEGKKEYCIFHESDVVAICE